MCLFNEDLSLLLKMVVWQDAVYSNKESQISHRGYTTRILDNLGLSHRSLAWFGLFDIILTDSSYYQQPKLNNGKTSQAMANYIFTNNVSLFDSEELQKNEEG